MNLKSIYNNYYGADLYYAGGTSTTPSFTINTVSGGASTDVASIHNVIFSYN